MIRKYLRLFFPNRWIKVVYEVSDHCALESKGDLIFGKILMHSVKVGQESFMTRGHKHLHAEDLETYYGISGTGVILMKIRMVRL